MNDLQATYKLVKKIMILKEELVSWGRLSRQGKLTEVHEKVMMKHAFDIDELLREIGVEFINDYESNQKIKASLKIKS